LIVRILHVGYLTLPFKLAIVDGVSRDHSVVVAHRSFETLRLCPLIIGVTILPEVPQSINVGEVNEKEGVDGAVVSGKDVAKRDVRVAVDKLEIVAESG